jgi:hypothetical protein
MNILIPVDCTDEDEAQLVSLDNMKSWILLEFEDGRVIKSSFFDTKDEIKDWIDVMIVISNKEYVWPYMEEGIAILVAPLQRYIEDIMEAYIFKELHELTI